MKMTFSVFARIKVGSNRMKHSSVRGCRMVGLSRSSRVWDCRLFLPFSGVEGVVGGRGLREIFYQTEVWSVTGSVRLAQIVRNGMSDAILNPLRSLKTYGLQLKPHLTACLVQHIMTPINSATLRKGVEVGHRTGQKVAIRVRNICTHFANTLGTPKCDIFRLLQKTEHDLDRLAQIRTDLTESQVLCIEKLRKATVDVYSCKAVLEKPLADLVQSLTSSLRGLESFMLNFEHVESELGEICDAFCKLYFEARYGEYLVAACSSTDKELLPFCPSSTTDFTDPEEIVKSAEFDLLSRRVIEDLSSLESDFYRLPLGIRDNPDNFALVEKGLKSIRDRYFTSLNWETGNYQLSDYGTELQQKKERREREIAAEAVDERSDDGMEEECCHSSQHLEEYDILDSEIYRSDGTSWTTTDYVSCSERTSDTPSDGEG